jgi:ABC-type multidrug transport system ATPase subunit
MIAVRRCPICGAAPQQDDVLYESLTVYETLLYAGLLRLPRAMPVEEKRRRVEAVISGLGLTRSRGTIIGGFFRRGISGGVAGWLGGWVPRAPGTGR